MIYVTEMTQAWQRRRNIWERHAAGETYISIARDLGITPPRVRELALAWDRRQRYIAEHGGSVPPQGELPIWRHPIVSGIMATPLETIQEKRAMFTVWRQIYMKWGDMADWDYQKFLDELAKPDGGEIASVKGIGPMSIDVLRKRCLRSSNAQNVYGYA